MVARTDSVATVDGQDLTFRTMMREIIFASVKSKRDRQTRVIPFLNIESLEPENSLCFNI